MFEEAKRKGLDGFAITDHNTSACIDYFLQHGMMREDGQPVDGILIIPGQEITTRAGHLLALGVRLPDLKGIAPEEAIELIHQGGGLAIPPHPYDMFRAGIRATVMDKLDIDGVEVFNAATTLRRYNRMANDYAKRRGLPMTAGSDAHHEDALGVSYTILEPATFDLAAVLESIRRPAGLQQTYITAKDALRKTFNNIFRIKRPRRAAKPRRKS